MAVHDATAISETPTTRSHRATGPRNGACSEVDDGVSDDVDDEAGRDTGGRDMVDAQPRKEMPVP
ncbi:hypothetical protein AB870_02065 [Pandoraea faecigallinarum]|uniref:Uncharacterized protein n=1 Tax=Pandoraea faecigallinarum TaxID=656179 RepID=A0A0H3WP38_9BURK|nr:hypothetical protein AB870_02065 [Pandoraea faecigallinarum]